MLSQFLKSLSGYWGAAKAKRTGARPLIEHLLLKTRYLCALLSSERQEGEKIKGELGDGDSLAAKNPPSVESLGSVPVPHDKKGTGHLQCLAVGSGTRGSMLLLWACSFSFRKGTYLPL